MLTPPSLKPGDLIRMVCHLPIRLTAFDTGINLLKSLGYKVAFRDAIFESHDYLAGDDDRVLKNSRRPLMTPMRLRSGAHVGLRCAAIVSLA